MTDFRPGSSGGTRSVASEVQPHLDALTDEKAARAVGITTTVPVEMIYAAGLRPLDLNNVFITSGMPGRLVEEAEQHGFPRNSCAWNKGLYAAARRLGLRRIVAVVQGDCSNTHALAEMLASDGLDVLPFAYPYSPDDDLVLNLELDRFAERLGTDRETAEAWKPRLDDLRALAHRIDELAWRDNRATGAEQALWTISCSDFFGEPERFRSEASQVIESIEARQPDAERLRLALIGIPPICDDIFGFLESRGARIVFNEVPRQFAMPYSTSTLQQQYSRYTYPYDIFVRLRDIKQQLAVRGVRGVIHYVQSFCFRQIQDAIVRRELDLPILTLEGDRPGPMDMRTQTRIEAFLEMLRED